MLSNSGFAAPRVRNLHEYAVATHPTYYPNQLNFLLTD